VRYAVIVMLDSEMTPQTIVNEIVSNLEFDGSTETVVRSVVVLIDDATEVAVYDKEQK
jgi:hypothetical protein